MFRVLGEARELAVESRRDTDRRSSSSSSGR